MDQALLLIQAYQTWIYLILAVAFVLYARSAFVWWRSYGRAEFGLERERARRGLTRAAVMAIWVFLVAGLTFLAATVLSPAVPAALRPTPLPTVSLLATPLTPAAAESGPAATALPEAALDASGCQNAGSTLTFPSEASELSGSVKITGTADIPNFAFYKYEYIELAGGLPAPGAVWRAISAGTTPVDDGELGAWDTTLVIPGDYAFRLVVTDTAGNAPLPCVRRVRVLPGG
ncbi:MAG TPA: hypothetical protein VK449_09840 [Anaerolineales bacterium]|nr:hypothetical protein [Anaerolineales bacterium]